MTRKGRAKTNHTEPFSSCVLSGEDSRSNRGAGKTVRQTTVRQGPNRRERSTAVLDARCCKWCIHGVGSTCFHCWGVSKFTPKMLAPSEDVVNGTFLLASQWSDRHVLSWYAHEEVGMNCHIAKRRSLVVEGRLDEVRFISLEGISEPLREGRCFCIFWMLG